jgi:hypothetical protein
MMMGIARSAIAFSNRKPYSTIGSPGMVSSKYGPIFMAISSASMRPVLPGSETVELATRMG